MLPQGLINKSKQGKLILFLGSGAAVGATATHPSKVLIGNQLRDEIADYFFNGDYKDSSLQYLSELTISEYSLFDLQDFIKDLFENIEPAHFHFQIPQFHWRAIFSTNYDQIIEKSYNQYKKPLQELVPVLSHLDTFDETKRTNDKLALIKLHGCISRNRDPNLPLILTIDQYNDYLENRKRLFQHLYDLAFENSIVFVGHSLQDADIRKIVSDVHKEVPSGQRHYIVKPSIPDPEIRLWERKKITPIDCGFEQFLNELSKNISIQDRELTLIRPSKSHPIEKSFSTKDRPSDELTRFLTDSVEYLSESSTYQSGEAQDFYRGADLGWYPIADNLSIERSVEERIKNEVILKPETERANKPELFVLKGEAGSGKTTTLRNLAWKLKDSGLGIFLWMRDLALVDMESLQEITQKTSERIFLFWDNASINQQKIITTLKSSNSSKIPITILTAERHNEWNIKCEQLENYVDYIKELQNLSSHEIKGLIDKLETYDCLGPNLKPKTAESRFEEFSKRCERQLLVGLHEATMGRSFEDIVQDEYSKIQPITAQSIYRTVCTLNRIRVPVRAGLIARIHGVDFLRFKDHFFKPLEKVVMVDGERSEDTHYKARHPEIAEIIFNRVLTDRDDRYNEYIRILEKINISYESDKHSFRAMIKAKSLHDLFSDVDDVNSIYELALESCGKDSYILQQMANYERIRPNGNFPRAISLLEEASLLSPNDGSIIHTLSVTWRSRSQSVDDIDRRRLYREESRRYLDITRQNWGESPYIAIERISLAIEDLKDILEEDSSTDRVIDESIRRVEKELSESKQKYPSEGLIFKHEADFAEILDEDRRALAALEKSFEENNRDPYIAIRLAAVYEQGESTEKAKGVLLSALERKRHDQRLNFAHAELLRKEQKSSAEDLAYYYKRAFVPNDSNYQSQFWYARYAFELPNPEKQREADRIFTYLRNARIPFRIKNEVRDTYSRNNKPIEIHGKIVSKKPGFCFIEDETTGKQYFCPAENVLEDLYAATRVHDRVKFKLGFCYAGPKCFDVEQA